MSDRFAVSVLTIAAVAFLATLLLTAVVRGGARRFGIVAKPKSDRWHRSPTAMFGGVAIFAGILATISTLVPLSRDRIVVIAASSILFLVGLLDDIFQIKPYQKLIGQLMGAAVIVYFGLLLPWTQSFPLNTVITLFWLVGITNAVNMLDNMDGLAAGVSAIAAAFLGLNFYANHQIPETLMLAAFAGALIGFLIYNHHPASIFMGDCGSMLIGFFLSSSALLAATGGGGRSRSVVAVLAVPVLVLCIPIFDTTFVTLTRKLAGRPASQGGRDHTSHRLVALGLSETRAVWMLYAFAVSAGCLAMFVRQVSLDVSVALIAVFVLVMTVVGVYLGRVRVYGESEIASASEKPLVAFLVDLSYKRRVFEVLLDVTLIALAYYSGFLFVFGPINQSQNWQLFLKTLPVIVFLKLGTFLVTGVYRGLWKYASLSDVAVFAKAVFVSSLVMVVSLVLVFRFQGVSRTVVVVDGVVLMALVTTSRFAFRVLRRLIGAPHARSGRRVLIFGAGDGGELLYRELNNNQELQRVPIAFIDDDSRKTGRLLHGLRVYPASRSITELCRRLAIDEVFLSTSKISNERINEVIADCATVNVPVKRMRIDIERLADVELGWIVSAEASAAATEVNIPIMPTVGEPLVHAQPHSRTTEH